MRIDPESRLISPKNRGASNLVNKAPSPVQNGAPNQGTPLSGAEWKAIVEEISAYLKLASEEIGKPLPKPLKKIKGWIDFEVPIDNELLLSSNISRELNFRMFEVALKEVYGITNYSRFTIRFIMERKVWRVGKPGTEEELKILIAKKLGANNKTITYSTPDLQLAVNFYFRWKEEQRDRFRAMNELRKHAPDVGWLMVKDFYKAHWNGVLAVVEGLGSIALAPTNLALKAAGRETRFNMNLRKVGLIRAKYDSSWGKKYGGAIETGVALGMPVGWLSKAPSLFSKLPLVEQLFVSGLKVKNTVRAIMLGSTISDITLTAWDVADLFKVLITGRITANGKIRAATPVEIAAVKEQLLSLGLNLVLDAGVTNAVAKKQAKPIGKALIKVEEHPNNSDWSTNGTEIVKVKRNTISASKVLIGTKRTTYRKQAAKIINETPNHPLKKLLNANGELKSSFRKSHDKLWDNPDFLEMGHYASKKSGEAERIVLQSGATNQFDRLTVEGLKGAHAYVRNEALSISAPGGLGAVAIELRTAKDLVDFGILKQSVFDNAPLIIF